MKRFTLVLLALSVVLVVRPARAQDGIQNVAFFYPLRTRRPVIERELEVRVEHAKTADGRVTEAAAAVELPILPRWQVEVEVPLIFREPREGAAQGGVGDLRVENKVMVWQSLDWLSQIAVGVESRLPTGSERRGLGGEAAVEPFVTGGIALGDFDLLASVAYEFNVNAHVPGPNEQELTASAAAGGRAPRQDPGEHRPRFQCQAPARHDTAARDRAAADPRADRGLHAAGRVREGVLGTLQRVGPRRRRGDAAALGRVDDPVARLEHALGRAGRRDPAIGHPHRVVARRRAHRRRRDAAHRGGVHLVHRALGRGGAQRHRHRAAREQPGEASSPATSHTC